MSSDSPKAAADATAPDISTASADLLQRVAELTAQQHGHAAAFQAIAGAVSFGVGFMVAYIGEPATRGLLESVLSGCHKLNAEEAAAVAAKAIEKAGRHG